MNKKLITIVGMAAALMILSGCCLSHNYIPATCTTAATCTKCGKTEGTPLGHTWVEATCTTPKTCSICGATEGNALDHTWVDATCTEPKTCSVCGTSEGEALGHTWTFATVNAPKTCTVCGATEGDPVTYTIQDLSAFDGKDTHYHGVEDRMVYVEQGSTSGTLVITTLDGTEIKRIYFDTTRSWCYCVLDSYIGISYSNKDYSVYYGSVYDYDGNELLSKEFPSSEYSEASYPGYIAIYDNGSSAIDFYNANSGNDIGYYYDFEKGAEITRDEYYGNTIEPTFDTSNYSYCGYSEIINGYFIGDKDGKWGYTDIDGNVISLYADASEFSDSGYALVTEDGKHFSIIDSEFNIVGENVIDGSGVSCTSVQNSLFRIKSTDASGNETATYYIIK